MGLNYTLLPGDSHHIEHPPGRPALYPMRKIPPLSCRVLRAASALPHYGNPLRRQTRIQQLPPIRLPKIDISFPTLSTRQLLSISELGGKLLLHLLTNRVATCANARSY